MKPGYKVKYIGIDTAELINKRGKVIRKTRFNNKELWEVNFFNDIGIRHVLENNLEIVSRQFQLSFTFPE